MQTLSIDLETRSSVDIAKAGVYRYAESDDFDILLFGVSVDNRPVRVYDLAGGERIPEEILTALTDSRVLKSAYNASFERVCLSYWLRKYRPDLLPEGYLDPTGWQCTLVWGAYNGLPLGLEKIGAVLELEDQKLKEGKTLIRYFCCPRSSRTSADGRQADRQISLVETTPDAIAKVLRPSGFHSPSDAPEKWELFKKYNMRDVEVELQIREQLAEYPVPDRVWEEYALDQEINDRGIRIDMELVTQAIRMDERSKADLTEKLKELTGMENPNSVAQLKQYLTDHGIAVDSLGKKEAAELIKTVPEEIGRVLTLRLQIAKSSVKKYQAMMNCVCRDGRCRGLFQFYGASRTGRWAGRLIQLQNLPQNHLPDLEQARDLVRQGDYEMLSLLYPSVPGILSELIRTAFIPEDGMKFIVSDYSAVEARALSFLAGEKWRMEVFHNGGDIYCKSASAMFKVPVEKHGQNAHLRQKGKLTELSCGYGGSVGALKAMGAVDMGIPEEELKPLVDAWRNANPKIVEYWWKVDEAIKASIELRIPHLVGKIRFHVRDNKLFITLPSGRRLAYISPRIEPNQFGGESITYYGTDAQKHWNRIESYGPKFVENIVQAVCRDLLAETLKNLCRYRIVGHVHDEVIIEVPKDTPVETITEIMEQTPDWIRGLELRGDGFETGYYQK